MEGRSNGTQALRLRNSQVPRATRWPSGIYGEVFDALKDDLTPYDLADTTLGDEEKWAKEIRQTRRTMIETWLVASKGKLASGRSPQAVANTCTPIQTFGLGNRVVQKVFLGGELSERTIFRLLPD
jgi:hypothetical protein